MPNLVLASHLGYLGPHPPKPGQTSSSPKLHHHCAFQNHLIITKNYIHISLYAAKSLTNVNKYKAVHSIHHCHQHYRMRTLVVVIQRASIRRSLDDNVLAINCTCMHNTGLHVHKWSLFSHTQTMWNMTLLLKLSAHDMPLLFGRWSR